MSTVPVNFWSSIISVGAYLIGLVMIGLASVGLRGQWIEKKLEAYEKRIKELECIVDIQAEKIGVLENTANLDRIDIEAYHELATDHDCLLAIASNNIDKLTAGDQDLVRKLADSRQRRINDTRVKQYGVQRTQAALDRLTRQTRK